MNYPLISDYVSSILSAEDNFEELTNLRPVLDEEGQPIMSSGNFAVVFKMKDEQTGKLYAVKCFLKEQEGRSESYRLIAEELEFVSSSYLTPIRYLENELFVDSSNTDETEFPVLLMDWIEGVTLDKYIRTHIVYTYDLAVLAYRFSKLASWLLAQSFAHGDLKSDNIIVRDDGSLTLVDYDGMYVPTMSGKKARELGSPDFRHPSRTEKDFNEHIDDFPLISILLSLKVISLHPNLWKEYRTAEHLLFSETDYRDIGNCKLIKEIFPSNDTELNIILSIFTLTLEKAILPESTYRWLNLNSPQGLKTEVSENDLKNAWIDEYGAKYSKDKTRLLYVPHHLEKYSIRFGTKVICDKSLSEGTPHITIPATVCSIGINPFGGKPAFVDCKSDAFIVEDGLLLSRDKQRLISCLSFEQSVINIPEEVRFIDKYAFNSCVYEDFLYFIRLQNDFFTSKLRISYSTTIIVPNIDLQQSLIQKGCNNVIVGDIFIDEYGVVYNVDKTKLLCFPKNLELSAYHILEGCEEIVSQGFRYLEDCDGDFLYLDGNNLTTLYLPSSLIRLGEHALRGCNSLKSLMVPQGTMSKFIELLPELKHKLKEYEEWDSYYLANISYPLLSGWKIRTIKPFSKEEISRVKKAKVVLSKYGKNVRFYLNNGSQLDIPLLDPNTLFAGDIVEVSKVEVVTFYKLGEADILRIKV